VMDLRDMTSEEKWEAASDPNTPKDTLGELAKSENVGYRAQVAKNPNTPGDALRELAKDYVYWDVRASVVYNPNTPDDVLLDLATDTNMNVRRYVANNPKSSSKILVSVFEYEKSLKEPDRDVIRTLYKNPKLPHVVKVIIETLFAEML